MNKGNNKQYKYIMYFTTAFITFYLTQEILVNRFISVGFGYIQGGAFIYFSSPLIIDIVTEVYGYKMAKKLLWCGLIAPLFMAACIYLALHAPSPTFWQHTNSAYSTALSTITEVAVVSSIFIFIGQRINAYLINRWRIILKGRYFWLRSVGSSIVGDSVTVTLALTTLYAGKVSFEHLISNIVPQLLVLLLCSTIGAIPASIIAKLTARSEGLQDIQKIDYNPFK